LSVTNGLITSSFVAGIGVTVSPFALTDWGLIELDFANNQPTDQLFQTVSVPVEFFTVSSVFFPCQTNTITVVATPLNVNMMPLTAPIAFNLTGATITSISGTFSYDAGSNVLRGVLFDFSAATCVLKPFPINGVYKYRISEFTVGATNECHRPQTKTECRHLTGFVFEDVDSSGDFDGNIDGFPQKDLLMRIQPLIPGEFEDYSTLSALNGTYWTECYEVGQVLEISLEPRPDSNVTTMNSPQNYTVMADCINEIPPIGLNTIGGIIFRVYNDANNNGTYDTGEAGFPNIDFKITKLTPPNVGEMQFATSDAMGFVFFDNVTSSIYLLDLVNNSSLPLFGFVQTEGMDPTNITVVVADPDTVVEVGDFGYYMQPATCAITGTMRLFIDHFDGSNATDIMTNETLRDVESAGELINTGLGMERDAQLIALTPPWESRYVTSNLASTAMLMVNSNTTAALLLQWDGVDGNLTRDSVIGLGGVDLTQGGVSTAITLQFNRLCGDYLITLTAGDDMQSETQTIKVLDAGITSTAAVFFFIDPTVYQTVTFVELTFQVINPMPSMAHVLLLDYVASECVLCQQTITFDEPEWMLGQNSSSVAAPFAALESDTKVLPYAHQLQLTQALYTVSTVLGSQALMTSDETDVLTIDVDSVNEGSEANGTRIRKIILDLLIADSSGAPGCSASTPTGPTIKAFDENGAMIYSEIVAGPVASLGGGVYGVTQVVDAGSNRIKTLEIDYSAVVCAPDSPSGTVIYGIDNLILTADGACGGNVISLPEEEPVVEARALLWQPIVASGAFVLILLSCCCCCWCAADPRRRRRRYKKKNSRIRAKKSSVAYKRV
jgi:hypothetical protein